MYQTVVKAIGSEAGLFKEEQMLILFGENAPETLKNYCYNIEVLPVERPIEKNMTLRIGDDQYRITAVGNVVTKNLHDLGHLTIKFDGAEQADLPGSLHVALGEYPDIQLNTKITIN